ncbi:GPI-anchored protein LORELEI-like [Dorcoceras hygrometricum]|uniref:GPI-anchored protein LORELEI-like n=1 Tax=Dorcoceras hygrometricum TaxID=472368 RepID=A0A2Z7B1H5_9LAMI|nr:GPI-anchored protein LORELEI-like [Dorcoceras hygrometricum]
MMGSSGMKCWFFVIVFLFLSTSFEASPFISDGKFGSHNSGGRRLLQAKTPCPVSFEFQNYTIITSKCKGPKYPADICCSAFKDFACPFVDSLNDLRNDCATIMFSYINMNGKYPGGLFASMCREGKEGLECPELPPPSEKANKNLGASIRQPLPFTMLIVTSLALTLQYF